MHVLAVFCCLWLLVEICAGLCWFVNICDCFVPHGIVWCCRWLCINCRKFVNLIQLLCSWLWMSVDVDGRVVYVVVLYVCGWSLRASRWTRPTMVVCWTVTHVCHFGVGSCYLVLTLMQNRCFPCLLLGPLNYNHIFHMRCYSPPNLPLQEDFSCLNRPGWCDIVWFVCRVRSKTFQFLAEM